MRKYIGRTEVEDQRDPNKTEEQRNRGILARIAKVDGAIVEDIGIHPDLKLRAGDDREQIITGVREAAARLIESTSIKAKPEDTTVMVFPKKSNGVTITPENLATITLILARFDQNPYKCLPNHTPEDRQILIDTLSHHTYHLGILERMDSTGGRPTYTGIEGDELVFDEIVRWMPDSRRRLDYKTAESRAYDIGAPLISEDRFLKIANEYKIPMDPIDWVWINSKHRPDLLNNGRALIGDSYRRKGRVLTRYDGIDLDKGGFRCSLRVKIVRK